MLPVPSRRAICSMGEGPHMFEELAKTLSRALYEPAPEVQTVIRACDALAGMLSHEVHLPLLMRLGMSEEKAAWEIEQARSRMCASALEARLYSEFGPGGPCAVRDIHTEREHVREQWHPLGVLLHVSAGNVDALPVYSVIEGLLTGNINLLKLPAGESGLSEGILEALFALEPSLRSRVHVFDFRAEETQKLKALAALSDAVVLWGSDEAVQAIRTHALPQTKLIEWGPRLSFAYVSPEADDAFLRGVAHDMCFTSQLYCSSAQGIFVDTRDEAALLRFARLFLSILESEAAAHPAGLDALMGAGVSLGLYADSLEADLLGKGRVLRGAGCSVTVCTDSVPEGARRFGNCWVKPLPKEEILPALRPYAGYLQNVALSCAPQERAGIERALIAAGAVRICDGYNLSHGYCDMPRDGILPLTRYMKRVSVAQPDGV